MLTRNEVNNEFYCGYSKCYDCSKSKECEEETAEKYRNYITKTKKILDKNPKFICDYVKGKCKRNKCKKYRCCTRKAKKNIDKWYSAYNKNQKEILKELSKGGI